MMGRSRALSLFLLISGLCFTGHAFATFAELSGIYEGQRTINFTIGSCQNGSPANPSNTRPTKTTFTNFDPTLGTFDVLREIEVNGTFYPRTGSGKYISASQIQYTASGPTSAGGTVNVTITETVALDSTSTYVTSLNTTASGVSDNSAVGSWTCPFTATGTSSRVSGPITGEVVNPETSASSTVLNNTTTLNQVVSITTNTLNARIQSAMKGFVSGFRGLGMTSGMYELNTGLSAGDDLDLALVGFWGSYSYTDFENDFSRTKYDGSRHMFMGGVDFSPHEKSVLGISFGYEDGDVDTDFNNGEADSDGYTIAPYFGMVIDDTWNFDLSAGYSNIDTDQYRTAAGARITSDVDTDRWFFSGNLNGFTQQGNWLLTGRFGAMYALSEDDAYMESNGTIVDSRKNKLSQFNLGGEAAYSMGEFEPYISGQYSYDMTATDTSLTAGAQPDNDHSDFLLGLGFRYFSKDNLSITAEYTNRLGRSDYDEESLSLNARWDF
jgi:hypothetical protein